MSNGYDTHILEYARRSFMFGIPPVWRHYPYIIPNPTETELERRTRARLLNIYQYTAISTECSKITI